MPRHRFLEKIFARIEPRTGLTLWTPIDAQRVGRQRWLEQIYADDQFVTQLDFRLTPADVSGSVTGTPTSWASRPSLLLRMWEALGVRDGHNVLEVGTGTGYSTALGCHRLGDNRITSVEFNPIIAAKAQRALHRADYHPRLIQANSFTEAPDDVPYDRIIVKITVPYVPPVWLRHSMPGTVIIVPLAGSLAGTLLARLTVDKQQHAEGHFLTNHCTSSLRRIQACLPAVPPLLSGACVSRPTALGPDAIMSKRSAQAIVQFTMSDILYLELSLGSKPFEHVFLRADGSSAVLTERNGAWTVDQRGNQRVWDKVEETVDAWRSAGQPDIDALRIHVTNEYQHILLGDSNLGSLTTHPDADSPTIST